jgi:hypothetical protein
MAAAALFSIITATGAKVTFVRFVRFAIFAGFLSRSLNLENQSAY